MSNKSSAVTRKKKLVYDMDLVKKQLVDLQVMSDSDLFDLAEVDAEWGLKSSNADATDVLVNPTDMKAFINNVSNGINYYNIYMSTLNESAEIVAQMKEVKVAHDVSGISTARKAELDAQYDQLKAKLDMIGKTAAVNGTLLYGAASAVQYGTGATVDHVAFPMPVAFDPNLSATASATAITTAATTLATEIATATDQLNELVFHKSALANQYDYTIDGMAEYKDFKENELKGQIDNFASAIEALDDLYNIRFFS